MTTKSTKTSAPISTGNTDTIGEWADAVVARDEKPARKSRRRAANLATIASFAEAIEAQTVGTVGSLHPEMAAEHPSLASIPVVHVETVLVSQAEFDAAGEYAIGEQAEREATEARVRAEHEAALANAKPRKSTLARAAAKLVGATIEQPVVPAVHATSGDWTEAEAEAAEVKARKQARIAKLAKGEAVAPIAQPDLTIVKGLLRATSDQRIALAKDLGVKVIGKTREQSAKLIARGLCDRPSAIPAWLDKLVSNAPPVRAPKATSGAKRTKGEVSGLVALALADLRVLCSVKDLAEKHGVAENKIRGAIDALRGRFGKAAVTAMGGGTFLADLSVTGVAPVAEGTVAAA